LDREAVDFARLIREAFDGSDERRQVEACAELQRHGVFVYPFQATEGDDATLTRAESTP